MPLPLLSELTTPFQILRVHVLHRWSFVPRLNEVPDPDELPDKGNHRAERCELVENCNDVYRPDRGVVGRVPSGHPEISQEQHRKERDIRIDHRQPEMSFRQFPLVHLPGEDRVPVV